MIAKIKRTKIKRTKVSFVCGQHIYKDIWYAVVGEVLVCEREPNNFQDRYA